MNITLTEGLLTAAGVAVSGLIAALVDARIKLQKSKREEAEAKETQKKIAAESAAKIKEAEVKVSAKEARENWRLHKEAENWNLQVARETADKLEQKVKEVQTLWMAAVARERDCAVALAVITTRLKETEAKLGIAHDPDDLDRLVEKFHQERGHHDDTRITHQSTDNTRPGS